MLWYLENGRLLGGLWGCTSDREEEKDNADVEVAGHG